MADHNELGKLGEEESCKLLEKKGFVIRELNWRYGRNEIDIIAEDSELILFVEVKTRSSFLWGMPERMLSISQMRRLQESANFYIQEYDIEKEPQFDVIAIVKEDDRLHIEHFEDVILPDLY